MHHWIPHAYENRVFQEIVMEPLSSMKMLDKRLSAFSLSDLQNFRESWPYQLLNHIRTCLHVYLNWKNADSTSEHTFDA